MSDEVLFERRGAIAIVTLNARETRNALSDRLVAALLDALATIDADEAIRCAILTGAGDRTPPGTSGSSQSSIVTAVA